jgi:phosphoesterase RecJ-like protein
MKFLILSRINLLLKYVKMDKMQQEIRKIQEVIQKGQHFLVMGHRSVDGDAYGSSMALYFYLQDMGKTVEVINESPITPLFHFLDIHSKVNMDISSPTFDAIFICDCGDIHLIGKFLEQYPEIFLKTPIINIDHHNRNNLFGTFNLVDTEASSTCELIYSLIESDYKNISTTIATLLLFGIIRDTNCFKNSIRRETFEITSKLYALGADYAKVIFHSYKSEKLNYLQLHGYVLENLISLR